MNIYVMKSEKRGVKIGISAEPTRRQIQLKTEDGDLPEIIHVEPHMNARKVERRVHEILNERALGGEWFDITPQEAIDAIQWVIASHPQFEGIHGPIKPKYPPCDWHEFRRHLDRLDLTQGHAAKFLGTNIRSINGYAAGRPIPNGISMLLRFMEKFNLSVAETNRLCAEEESA